MRDFTHSALQVWEPLRQSKAPMTCFLFSSAFFFGPKGSRKVFYMRYLVAMLTATLKVPGSNPGKSWSFSEILTYMRSWKSHRLTSQIWLGLNPQIGRPLSRIVVPLVYFILVYFVCAAMVSYDTILPKRLVSLKK
jgi:hypothetical protein